MPAASAPARADPLTPEQKAAVEALIRDTIANHPEIVIDALKAAQQKDRKDADEAGQAIAAQHSALLADPSSPVGGNPKGDVTIVEFFDYRCPYCKEVEPALERLLKEDGRLRIVYKEFPILGPASVYAARVALAARAQGKYDEFHRTMMAVKGSIDEDIVRRTASGVGIDMTKIGATLDDEGISRIIKSNFSLAEALDIDGTPAFIVGDALLPGAADIDTLRQAVAKVRPRRIAPLRDAERARGKAQNLLRQGGDLRGGEAAGRCLQNALALGKRRGERNRLPICVCAIGTLSARNSPRSALVRLARGGTRFGTRSAGTCSACASSSVARVAHKSIGEGCTGTSARLAARTAIRASVAAWGGLSTSTMS